MRIADYFASTINNDSIFANELWGGLPRYLNNTRSLSGEVLDDSHDDSQIFSGALWNLRGDAGQSVADRLVFEAMYKPSFNDKPRDFQKFFDSLLTQDDVIYSNNNTADGTPHSAYIQNSFAKHGMDYDPEMITLPDDYPTRAYLNSTDTDKYNFYVNNSFAAIGIKPPIEGTDINDFDVFVYSDLTMNNKVNESRYEANNIDFVVVNGHSVGFATYYGEVEQWNGVG